MRPNGWAGKPLCELEQSFPGRLSVSQENLLLRLGDARQEESHLQKRHHCTG